MQYLVTEQVCRQAGQDKGKENHQVSQGTYNHLAWSCQSHGRAKEVQNHGLP